MFNRGFGLRHFSVALIRIYVYIPIRHEVYLLLFCLGEDIYCVITNIIIFCRVYIRDAYTHAYTMDDLFKFAGDNVENVEKINLDELYEKKQEQDKNKLFTYNKILTRIHEKIKLTSRQKCHQQFCWFIVPEIILGVANYDHAGCIAYLVDKLQENKFMVRYTHPNLLLISWHHYVPNYVRNEFKKKTGTAIDEYGRPILYDDEGKVIKYNDGGPAGGGGAMGGSKARPPEDANTLLYNERNPFPGGGGGGGGGAGGSSAGSDKKEYKSTDSYRPTGNLVYNQEYFQKLEDRLN